MEKKLFNKWKASGDRINEKGFFILTFFLKTNLVSFNEIYTNVKDIPKIGMLIPFWVFALNHPSINIWSEKYFGYIFSFTVFNIRV